MASVCSIRDYIIQEVVSDPGVYYYWDKVDKVLRFRSYASIPDYYELNTGSIIDVIQDGLTTGVSLIIKSADTNAVIDRIFLSSTSGDFYNTLLSASVSARVLTVKMWARIAKEETTLTFPMQVFDNDSPANAIIPCFNDFELANGTVLNSYCDGFTYNETTYFTSPQGVDIVQTANSVVCGYSAPAGPFRFSEEKTIEYKSCILSNPVYMVWKNLLGGWDYWLFQKNQIESLDTESLGIFTKNYSRISEVNNPITERGKSAGNKIILGAEGLTTDQKRALTGILMSNKVYILNSDGSINREVQINSGSFVVVETESNVHSLEFQINDAPINTIKN